MQRNTNRRIAVQTSSSINQDPISKITNAKRGNSVAQVVVHLPSEVLSSSSTPSTAKSKKKKKSHSQKSLKSHLEPYFRKTEKLFIVMFTHKIAT
jgi:hypothetical protein